MRRIADWLQHSLAANERRHSRKILRFTNPGDYRSFLEEWVRRLPGIDSPTPVRALGLIQALACPIPEGDSPPSPGDRIICEEDEKVAIAGLPKGEITSDKGIPWGVRRIKAPEAWSRTTGHRIRVGVIDTGVDFQHPDLAHSLERGINLLQRSMLPQDDNGHGTHIAGTIAAANQYYGMMGVAPRASVHPIKAFDNNGTAYVSDIVLGIDWCVRNHIDVVNMSFGMRTRSKSLLNAVAGAYRSGVLIVASSGNDGRKEEIDYPARYHQSVAVGAINRQGRIAAFTNRSPLIDIYAPGERISSAWIRGKHRIMSGTSMATSHVTGAVALLLSYRPGLSPAQIKAILKQSAKPLKYGKAPRLAGELDISRMLHIAERDY
ncbi:S8 family serine peptidase [Cohnella faecalis]|uniref:Peptidase S8 n=1 Tax=Cohnella faecalis TaxID=2315694 RepID=A0A398CGR2_9BACL|nr:S8 family peptidase [Cohnella faecalis]RIE01645.1 peptidase S8 [Cohnella faecalis]